MTKLYISADLEGVCGVVSPHHCSAEPDRSAYDWAVSQLEMEVAAVVEAALDHGVSEVLVNDSHCTMTNLYLEQVDPRVSLLTGKPKRCAMSAGLDERFDAAIYIGYHAKAGAHKGVLSHTFHSKLFDVSVNGVSYGEGGINALYASLVHGVPLVLASGDRAFVEEIQPNDQRALFNLGTLYENQGKLEEARPYYEKAKGVEIGNTIGLEAIHRLEAIDAALKGSKSPAEARKP